MGSHPRVLLIAWDSADWKLVQELVDSGQMPALQALIERGTAGKLASLHPISPIIGWTTAATGKTPDKHGILGDLEPDEQGRLQPVSGKSRRSKMLWDMASERGLRTHVFGWFGAVPAEPVNGVFVTSQYARAGATVESVYPAELRETLEALRLPPDEIPPAALLDLMPRGGRLDQHYDDRVARAAHGLSMCCSTHNAATWTLENQPWDFAAVYSHGIGYFCEEFMPYRPARLAGIGEEDGAIFGGVVDAVYRFHDAMLGAMAGNRGTGCDDCARLRLGIRVRPPARDMTGFSDPTFWRNERGMVVVAGPGIREDHWTGGATILDVAPTVLALLGLPVGEDMDGRVPAAAFEHPPRYPMIPSWEAIPQAGTLPSSPAVRGIADQFLAFDVPPAPNPNEQEAAENLRFNLVTVYLSTGRAQEALPVIEQLYEAAPEQTRFQCALAQAYLGAGRLVEGERRLGAGFATDRPVRAHHDGAYRAMVASRCRCGGLRELWRLLSGTPFWCSLVQGDFIHVGTTTLLRKLLVEGISEQHKSAGVAIDCVLDKGVKPSPGSILIECNLKGQIRAGNGCVAHGLEGIAGGIETADDTVVHQVPVALRAGRRGLVIRVYGVQDDPKAPAARWEGTWFGRPIIEELQGLALDLAEVWPGIDPAERTLWNARLFPVCQTADEAWACARWMMRLPGSYTAERWASADRLSLETSAQWTDVAAAEAARSRRLQAHWCAAAVTLAESGADVRPMLAHSPGVGSLAEAGRQLLECGTETGKTAPSEGASRCYQAGMFFAQAGLGKRAESAREYAFELVHRAVGTDSAAVTDQGHGGWRRERVTAVAPLRIDLGGGWSDTPPFCLDWGGTALNAAITLNGAYPIHTSVERIEEPVIRCRSISEGCEERAVWRDGAELFGRPRPGDPFLVVRKALEMSGWIGANEPLAVTLRKMGGGLDFLTEVDVPMGSGLGTSSILAATVVRALDEMVAKPFDAQDLIDRTIRLEQAMTTGGGWQDQAGAIFPGMKLLSSGPGIPQRLRVEPISPGEETEREMQTLMLLYYTGIRRIARGLLEQIVGRYLARETTAVQVLHSIKTPATEMSYAVEERDWDHLGRLFDRHWELNRLLDPHTTNASINALLALARPYIRGAKLAGAGGGGFMMLLSRSEEAASQLREILSQRSRIEGGALYNWSPAKQGLVSGN